MRMKSVQLILIAMVVLTLAITGYAQGRGGMQGTSTTTNTGAPPQGGPGGGGRGMGPGGGDPGMMGGEFTLGSDGTIYVITRVAPTSTTSASATLAAYSGTTGKSNWSLTFDVGNVGKPVAAPDGRLFMVADGHPAMTDSSGTTVAAEDAQLIIVTASGTSTTVTLAGEIASAPVFFGTSSSYTYYFTVTSVSEDSSGTPVRTTVLYGFSKAGAQLFSITLSQ